mgnify:CR=1 FL=1
MPIHTPLPAPQVSNSSTKATEKTLPLGTNMNNMSPPRGKMYDGSDQSPSKLVVVPTNSTDDSSAASSEDLSQDSSANKIVKTEHKLFEESFGFEEPLLKENPHRFVLFPIQDNDVSDKRLPLTDRIATTNMHLTPLLLSLYLYLDLANVQKSRSKFLDG